MRKEKNISFYFVLNLVFLLTLLFSIRIYILFWGNAKSDFAFLEVLPGFLEDVSLALLTACLAYLALNLSKWLFLALIFPFELIIIITSYSNLQYVNFFKENLRLFDLEYVKNIGDLWASTATDMRYHPGEILFLLIPILVIVIFTFLIIRFGVKRIHLAKTLIILIPLLLIASFSMYASYRLQDKEVRRAYYQSNSFVWMIKDIPRIHNLIQTRKRLTETKLNIERKEPGSKDLELEDRPQKKSPQESLFIKERPFPLDEGYDWYDENYPFIKIPKKDAGLIKYSSNFADNSVEERDIKKDVPRNIVFIILEGYRSKDIDVYGGPYSFTPNFNELASKSIMFTNFLGHADMTSRALLGVLGSYYDLFKGASFMRNQAHFQLFTLPEILNLFGYSNYFINSWSADFDNRKVFLKYHGDFTIVAKESYPQDAEMAGWGYSDEETMRMAVKTMDRAEKPFFTIILTSTNHAPYEVPNTKYELGLEEGLFGKYLNTFAYTDYSLGFFFKILRTRKYFKDTIFFVFADHGNMREKEKARDRSLNHFESIHQIPLLIYDPLKEEGIIRNDLAGQIDLAPTVLDLLGIEIANHFVGQSLMKTRVDPYYLGYHGRDNPRSYYVNDSLLCIVNTETDLVRSYQKNDGVHTEFSLSDQKSEEIISRVKDYVKLIDWAIFNDRIWDKRIEDFYKILYKKDTRD